MSGDGSSPASTQGVTGLVESLLSPAERLKRVKVEEI